MLSIPKFRTEIDLQPADLIDATAAAHRRNRRRLAVFITVFLLTLVPGLIWNLTRPPEYRASAKLKIVSGIVAPQTVTSLTGTSSAELPPPQQLELLAQAQVITSRPILEEVHRRLEKEWRTSAFAETDPVVAMQNAIGANLIQGTDVVELAAVGGSPQLMARIVNTLIEAYHEQSLTVHDSASQEASSNLRDEIERLNQTIVNKRAQLAAFREQSGVVSSERAENEALARMKGLSESLTKANEETAKAEAKLRTLRESAASGRSPVLAKDNPTLAAIEARISVTREQLRDMERSYTPQFMAMDPNAKALRARLAELENQLVSTRLSSQQAALATAEEEATSARAAADRLRGQIASQRREAQVFSGNFQEAKALEEDLVRIEGARRNATERLSRLEATQNTRMPSIKLIEAAAVPQSAWRPDYVRDALINLGISFLLGLLAIWFVELFTRTMAPPATTTVVVPQPWIGPALTGHTPALLGNGMVDAGQPPVPQLTAQQALPRELTQEEVGALLAGADDQGLALCALMLLGLTVDEVRALTADDLDSGGGQLAVRGASARKLVLPGWLVEQLAATTSADPQWPLFGTMQGESLAATEVATRVTYVALDAGLEEPTAVTPEALRHTFILHLLRHKVRFAQIAQFAGHLTTEELKAYANFTSGARQGNTGDFDPVMPALRHFSRAAAA
jgi:uncharacterized protein involved in exopolysaccharide biosynthesis